MGSDVINFGAKLKNGWCTIFVRNWEILRPKCLRYVKMGHIGSLGSHFYCSQYGSPKLGHIWVTTSIYGNMVSDVINDIVSKHVKQWNWVMKLGTLTKYVMENPNMTFILNIDENLINYS